MAKRSRIVIVDGEVKPLPISKKARTPVPKSRWRNGISNSQRRFIEERISATAQKERPYRFIRSVGVDYEEGAGGANYKGYGPFKSIRYINEDRYQELLKINPNKVGGEPGKRYLKTGWSYTTESMKEKLDEKFDTAYSQARTEYLAKQTAIRKVGVVLALDDILITKNRYGWSHVTLIDDDRGVEFNIRTKQADQWMKGYREFYSTTTAKHYLHKWEANTVAGREHAVDNHLRGLIKAYSAHGNEYKMNEIYELLRNGSYTEKKQYWENFWQNELPEIPEDFFVYPDLGVM